MPCVFRIWPRSRMSVVSPFTVTCTTGIVDATDFVHAGVSGPLQPAGFEALAGVEPAVRIARTSTSVGAEHARPGSTGASGASSAPTQRRTQKKEAGEARKRAAEERKRAAAVKKAEAAVERARHKMLAAQEALRRSREG